jgi:hypothetical protein
MSDSKHGKVHASKNKRGHELQLDILTDALMSGDDAYVANCLREAERVDGEPLDVLIRLLAGDPTLRKQQFPKRLKFSEWKGGRTPGNYSSNLAHDAKSSDTVTWKSGDENQVVKWLSELKCLEGEALNVLVQMLEGDLEIKKQYPKRLKFVGWERGRPPIDESLKTAEDANLVHVIKRRLETGDGLESVIAGLKTETKLSRSSLLKIWGAKARKAD